MSKNLYEALMKRQIRGKRWMPPRRSAYQRLDMVKMRLCEFESVLETSKSENIPKTTIGDVDSGSFRVFLLKRKTCWTGK